MLADALGVSPRSVLRMLEELGTACVAAGRAGRRRYAVRRPLRNNAAPIPVFRVNERGGVADAGTLDLVAPQGARFDLAAIGWPVEGAARDGWWEGLPYPFYDMRPQGFLGRMFARVEHAALEVGADPARWTDDDVVYVLARRGFDTAGNLIVGEPALRLHQQSLLAPARPLRANLAAAYARQADRVVATGVAGSSAAGEFPKFTAVREPAGGATVHVIVKFSGADRGAATTRWSDLLVCEHLALAHAARLPGVRAARSRIVQGAGRTFLESERFDRHGPHGRSPLASLEAIEGHLLGLGAHDWRAYAAALAGRELLDTADVEAIGYLWWYGRLIANGDMHLGNLSFVPRDGRLVGAPAYDMLPMAYAPLPGGEVPPRQWSPELPLPSEAPAWRVAAVRAKAFWNEAAADERISAGFRAIARANATSIERTMDRVG